MTFSRLDRVLDGLPTNPPGPGGAVAVLKDGKLVATRAWGWADMERRIRFTPETLFRICSISKQFTCAVMLDQFPDPAVLDGDLKRFMPLLDDPRLRATHLAHNQSGLRDYWATAMLCGAPVEGVFRPEDARDLIARTRSLQFAPGMRYSYCNHNFRLLGDMVEARTGKSLASLMRRRVFDLAGMPRALLCAETGTMPDGTIGYEGTLLDGWRVAENHIHWTGDAGIAASLEDMIAWEVAIDARRDDPDSLVARMSRPVTFGDGAPATYGFGLSRMTLLGRPAIGHGGGLRGWRSMRFYAPEDRVSVVVLPNHMGEPRQIALDLFAAVIDAPAPPVPEKPGPEWNGSYLEPETGLVVRTEATADGHIGLWFGQAREVLDLGVDGVACGGPARLIRTADGLELVRSSENLRSTLIPCAGVAPRDVEGVFTSAEYSAQLTCVAAGGALYGAFSGFLGRGMMQPMLPVGPDVWRLPCPRALDSAPPGDWTLQFRRNPAGEVAGVQVGCWLARGIDFAR
jgi:D-aminopeptidase